MANRSETQTAEAIMARPLTGEVIGKREGKHSLDIDRRIVWFRASTNQLCDDGIIIEPEAWREYMPAYMRNGVLLDSHNYSSIKSIVGHAVDWDIDSRGLLVAYQLDETPEGEAAWQRILQGSLRAVSVGWKTLESAKEVLDDKSITRVTQARLLEVSLVCVPMDDEALIAHLAACAYSGDCETALRLRSFLSEVTQHAGQIDDQRPGWEETENEIRYRVRDPKLFDPDSFRTKKLDVKGKGDVRLILGKPKKAKPEEKGKMILQALRFEKEAGWTLKEAKEWYVEHKDSLRSNDDANDTGERAIVPYKKFPLAPEDEPWSFTGDEGNAILEKGGWELYKACHTYYLGTGTPEKKAAYKLPHHKIHQGKVSTFWRGVAAAMQRLKQTNMPAAEKDRAYNHLAKHYKEFGKEPPERSLIIGDFESDQDVVYERVGKVLSAKNRELVENAIDAMQEAIAALERLLQAADGQKSATEPELEKTMLPAHWQAIHRLAELRQDVKDVYAELRKIRIRT